MGFQSIPIINFSEENLKHGTLNWVSTGNQIRVALEEYGCFVAECEKTPLKLQFHNEIFNSLKELFDLPIETKMKNVSDKPYHGYLGNQVSALIPPLHESVAIDFFNGEKFEAVDNFAKLMWPSGNPHFCENVISHYNIVTEMEQLIRRMIFESYGVEKYCDSHINSTAYLLRTLKYRIPEMGEEKNALIPHTDKSFFTLIHQNGVNGIEVKTKNGDWLGVDFSTNSFFVIAGDVCSAWSNGRIPFCTHRVLMQETKERYSIGLFSYHKGIIEIPNEMVDQKYPLKFRSFSNYGLLDFFSTDESHKEDSTAKAYCGVGE